MLERFTIEIPKEQAAYLRRIAELSNQEIEILLASALAHPIPPTESLDTQLEIVATYSDSQLWAIVETSVLSQEEDAAWLKLIEKSKKVALSAEEKIASEEFSELYGKRGLLRAKALVALQERGFNVRAYLDENAPN